MHGMTKSETVEFKRLRAMSAAMRTPADVAAVKRAAADWVNSARSLAARHRRRIMINAVRGAHSWTREMMP